MLNLVIYLFERINLHIYGDVRRKNKQERRRNLRTWESNEKWSFVGENGEQGCPFGKPANNDPERESVLKGLTLTESSDFREPRGPCSRRGKPLKRRPTLYYLPPVYRRSSNENNEQENSMSRHHLREKRQKKEKGGRRKKNVLPPFNGEFAYEMKEQSSAQRCSAHISTWETCFPFLPSADAYASSSIFACDEWPRPSSIYSSFYIRISNSKMHQTDNKRDTIDGIFYQFLYAVWTLRETKRWKFLSEDVGNKIRCPLGLSNAATSHLQFHSEEPREIEGNWSIYKITMKTIFNTPSNTWYKFERMKL